MTFFAFDYCLDAVEHAENQVVTLVYWDFFCLHYFNSSTWSLSLTAFHKFSVRFSASPVLSHWSCSKKIMNSDWWHRVPSCINIVHCECAYAVPVFPVVIPHTLHDSWLCLEARSRVQLFRIWTWHPIFCLGGSYIAWIIYFSLNLLPGVFWHIRNCCRIDSSESKIFLQSSAVQVSCCLANGFHSYS